MENKNKHLSETTENEKFPGYPQYPKEEDIFELEERVPDERTGQNEETHPSLDEGLDIPGAELDDAQEEVGSEDEENNYYSLGGDNHEDLEEEDGTI